MHDYFITGNIDEAKVREEAYRASVGDKRNPPEGSMLHFHEHGYRCDDEFANKGRSCEYIAPRQEEA